MIRRFLLFTLLSAAGISLSTGCEKEPQIITETITKTDTIYISTTDTVLVHVTDSIIIPELIRDTATTFILLRHAETTGIGSNPDLNAAGMERASELIRVLKNVSIDEAYSTDYNRTRQTAAPVAADKGLSATLYNPGALAAFSDGVLQKHKGGTVLVVGHSNTTPDLLNVLTGTSAYGLIPDTEYDNLFIVSVLEKGRAQVVHLKYGKP